MAGRRVTVTLDRESLDALDRLVRDGIFSSRSEAIRKAVEEYLNGAKARERAMLDPVLSKALADDGSI